MRSGLGLLKVLILMVIFAIIIVLGFGFFANGNLQVLESSWWTKSKEKASPIVLSGKSKSKEVFRNAKDWYDSQKNKEIKNQIIKHSQKQKPKKTVDNNNTIENTEAENESIKPVKINPIKNLKNAPLLHLEDNIGDASEHFAVALVAFKHIQNKTNVSVEKAQIARDHFKSTRVLLKETLPEYKSRSKHSKDLYIFGTELLERTEDLLIDGF